MTKEIKNYFLFVNGNKVDVSEKVYKVYWQETNHENYLERVDRNNNLLPFSSYDKDGKFIENIEDKSVDVEKIVETKMLLERLKNALSTLNEDEREIIEKLFFEEESLRQIAKSRGVTHQAVMKKRDRILSKLRELLKEF